MASQSFAANATAWVQFQDPIEQAFTLDVPQGWTVKGGLFRVGYSDIRPMVDLSSPDGRVSVRLGDVLVPSYSSPNAVHPREGALDDLGAQAQMIVAHYRTGQEFAALYARARFGQYCRGIRPRNFGLLTLPDSAGGGQVSYECDTAQGPRIVYVYAKTAPMGNIWQVSRLASFSATPDQLAAAERIVAHCYQSLRLNPPWIRYQNQMEAQGFEYQKARQQRRNAEFGAQMRQFESRMATMRGQVAAFQRGQQANQGRFQGFDNALVGITPIADPLTGARYDAWTGPKNGYWLTGTGQIVNSDAPPSPGAHRLNPR